MVLTEEQQTDAYPVASLEAATLSNEKLYYTIPDDAGTRVNKDTVAGYPSDTYTSPNDYIHKLNGNGTKVGSSMVLKVMSGDRVNIHAKSWYRLNGVTPGSPVSPLSDLVAALAGGVAQSAAGKYTAGELIGNGSLSPGMTDMLNTQSYSSSKPKAYVNWVLFDEQFKYVGGGSGFDQVGADQELKQHLLSNLPVTKNGYLYIYVSNETPNVDVFFDNLQVTHVRGALLEETHYYPFGLTMAGISSKAAGSLTNKYKFNGIEFNNDFDLNSYEAFYRTYDPQIGRFWQTDPSPSFNQGLYTAFDNNPILKNDILGDTAVTRWRSGFLGLGAKHEARYVGGTWIDSKTRNAIDPKSVRSGTRSIMNDYGKLNSISSFSAVTDKVNSAVNSVNLISGNGPASGGSEVNTPKYFSDLKAGVTNPDIDVYVAKGQSISSSIIEGNKGGQLPSYIGMGHELGHAWDILNSGSSTANFRQIPGLSPGLSNSEVNAMFWENVLRADAGMPLRTMYNYDAVRGAELPANINISNAGRLPLIGRTLQSVTLGSLNMGVTYKFLRIK